MELLVIAGATVATVSAVPYIRGVAKGNVRPKVASWLAWCLLAVLLTGAAVASGQMMSAIMSGVTAMTTAVVLVLGLKKGNKTLDKLDMLCLAGAAAGIAVWLILDNPALAILVAVLVDIIAFVPTLVHGWVSPEEESLASYGLASAGAGMGLAAAAMAGATLTGLAYPVYSTLFNGMMVLILTRDAWWPYLAYVLPKFSDDATIAE